jgi:Ni/Co efflux regulator RcnB
MRIANLLKWAIICCMMAVFVSFDAEPVNAASAAKNPSLTQQDKPLKKHRHNRRKHRRHRKWKRHHHRKGETKIEKKLPPKTEEKK